MDVVSIGVLVADLFASPIEALPDPGELKLAERFLLSSGGCASNTAACLRRLGRSVRVVGKVGDDLFGDFVVQDLERKGVDASAVSRSRAYQTSTTVILNVRGEDRRYLHSTGANAEFTLADLPHAALDDARFLYVGGYLALPGIAPEELAELFQQAARKGVKTVLDVVIPAGTPSPAERLRPVLPHTDYFLPNQDEARMVTGCDQPAGQAEALSRVNPRGAIVITRGSRGSYCRRGSTVIETPGFPMDSVDDSGAGDAFASGLMAALLDGQPLADALRFAGAVGASCTRALGCLDGVFTYEETMVCLAADERR